MSEGNNKFRNFLRKSTFIKYIRLFFKRNSLLFSIILQLTCVLVIFFQVNYLSCHNNFKLDLSHTKKYTLSNTTKNFIKSLNSEINIITTFTGRSSIYPEVKSLISEYQRTGKKISHENLDLRFHSSRISELNSKHKITFKNNQIILFDGDSKFKTIPIEDLVIRDVNSKKIVEFKGEDVLTSKMIEFTEQHKKIIYVVSGKQDIKDLSSKIKNIANLAASQNSLLEPISLEGLSDIPNDADALFFLGIDIDITNRELEIVRNFWNNKHGGIIVLLNPNSNTPNLDSLLSENGVIPNDDRVIRKLPKSFKKNVVFDVLAKFIPGSKFINEFSSIETKLIGQTKSLKVLHKDDILKLENIHPYPIMVASNKFWGEVDYKSKEIIYNPDRDNGFPDPVFISAIIKKGQEGDDEFKKGVSKMVIVGNSDIGSSYDMYGKINGDFIMSSINWVIDKEYLMGISPRKATIFSLNANYNKLGILQLIFIFLIPGLAFLLASVVWYIRR